LISRSVQYFHTLRHLKVRQLLYQGYYRFRRLARFYGNGELPLSVERRGEVLELIPAISKYPSFNNGTFSFLNRSKLFGHNASQIDWEYGGHGKLWVYNLNYFDFLLQPGMERDVGLALIDSFMGGVHQGSVGLQAYPVSLRGINWIKFLSSHRVQRTNIDASLYGQYLVLLGNVEYHLLGNHLLENVFSLLYGALYFREAGWFMKSSRLLTQQLNEQILGDGGHFELSPMYHQILLDRLLDCVNLLQNNTCFSGQDVLLQFLQNKAVVMLGWLKTITFDDGRIPHFNDATDGIAPTSRQLFDYAFRLGFNPDALTPAFLNESGYRKHCGKGYACVVDVGALGASYIPGHAHADALGFVLDDHDKPLLVDTGTSTYELGSRRNEERGSAAHNTVVVNDLNSSDVWGGFRVGRRARVRVIKDSESVVRAEHDGYRGVGVVHCREWRFETDRIVLVDRLRGKVDKAEARFHFDYALTPEVVGTMVIAARVKLVFDGAERIELIRYQQAVGFNHTEKAWCTVVHFSDRLDTIIEVEC